MLRYFWLILIGLACSVGIALLLPHLAGVEAVRFAQAEARWRQHAPSDYRAVVQHRYVSGGIWPTTYQCRFSIEVRAGSVRRTGGDCPETLDIDALFERFRPYIHENVPSRYCGYGGCSCALNTFASEYDPALGYPRRIARDQRDVTPGSGRLGRTIYALPRPARVWLIEVLNARSPCNKQTQIAIPQDIPIDREEIVVLSLTSL
jgi:hypothetical protein